MRAAALALLAPGCRSVSETTYVTRERGKEENEASERVAAGNMIGQLVAFAVNSQSSHR